MMMILKSVMTWLAAAASAFAALLWWYASTREVMHVDLVEGNEGYIPGSDAANRPRDKDGQRIIDPLASAELQSYWNRWAAIAAAVAAGAQAIALALPGC